MSHYLVLGAGKMGVVLAKDLLDSDPQCEVTLVDISSEALQNAGEFIGDDRLVMLQRDIENNNQRDQVIEGKDVVLCALLHRHALLVLESAIRYGVHFVDLIGEGTLERLEYDEEAKQKGITTITGCGVSPGITNVCVGRGVFLLDDVENAMVYVGGTPVHPKPPLNYRIVYAIDSLLNFYERDALIIKDGQQARVPALSALEPIEFPEPFTEMECFYTDGLNSMSYTMLGKIKGELAEKTIRHKGHVQGVNTLKACGFFSEEPFEVDGVKVIPKHVLQTILDSKLNLGAEQDATLLRVVVTGTKDNKSATHIFEMLDYYDTEKHYTSMAKTTSFPASIAAQMILSGEISQRGILFPEDVFHADLYNPFIEALERRGVIVTHSVSLE
jgi:lysine 6-dehydrogenase